MKADTGQNAINDAGKAKLPLRQRIWKGLAVALYGFRKKPLSFRAALRRMRLGSWSNRVALFLIFAAVTAGFATYGALTATPPFGNDPDTVIWLLNIDLVIVLLLVTLIARRIVSLWSGRRQGLAGSRLHVRLVFIFSLLAAAPAIIMTIFAAIFLHFGVQSWFSERVRTAVNESQAVAEAYLEEHMQVIRADTLAMANDLDRQASMLISNPEAFDKVIQTQSLLRNLSEAIVFDSSGRILARSGLTFTLEFESLPTEMMGRADDGEAVVMTGEKDDRVRALVKLNNFIGTYLFVGRMVDPVVLSHVDDTRRAVKAYEQLESQRSGLQVKITMIFLIVALLLLFAAIWFGLIFSRQLVVPISALISAADRVRAGDLAVRVAELDRQDEFDVLARAFNRMTSQIQSQRDELVAANQQLDERRRFIEAVLAGVSLGIVGVDGAGRITLANSFAAELFGKPIDDLTGQDITTILPDLASLFRQAQEKPGRVAQLEIPYTAPDETRRTLLVRVALELAGDERQGAVLTFDDITELQSAQRKAAWADVARRIAHEIKNPLTPIQLSAERLKRKYLKQIKEESEIFSQCTDTIIHHVSDIGRMVNEFSAFARMPEPVMKDEGLTRHVRDMLAFQQQAHTDIAFGFNIIPAAGKEIRARFDAQQIRQAFTNILQNAIDSVLARREQETDKNYKPRLEVLISRRSKSGDVLIAVTDNGLGLPKNEDPARLTDPYVTHKERGTGLGLAIVKKIMEDHGGRLVIGAPDWLKATEGWADLGGATVSLILPVDGAASEPANMIEQKKAIS